MGKIIFSSNNNKKFIEYEGKNLDKFKVTNNNLYFIVFKNDDEIYFGDKESKAIVYEH